LDRSEALKEGHPISLELRITVSDLRDYFYGLFSSIGLRIEKVFSRAGYKTIVVQLANELDEDFRVHIRGDLLSGLERICSDWNTPDVLSVELLVVVGKAFERPDIPLSNDSVKFCGKIGADIRVYRY
jgi:hypothetical protein